METKKLLKRIFRVLSVAVFSIVISSYSIPLDLHAENLINEDVAYAVDELNTNSLWNWQIAFNEYTKLPELLYGALSKRYDVEPEKAAGNFLLDNAGLFGLEDPLYDFVMLETVQRKGAYIVYVQTYNGIPVEYSYLLISVTHDNRISYVKYRIVNHIEINTNPALTEEEAYNIASEDARTIGYIEEPGEVELVILPDEEQTRLAWSVYFKAHESGTELRYLVGDNGIIIERAQEESPGSSEKTDSIFNQEDVKRTLNSIGNDDILSESKVLVEILRNLQDDVSKQMVSEAVITAGLNLTGGNNLNNVIETLKANNMLNEETYNQLKLTLDNICPPPDDMLDKIEEPLAVEVLAEELLEQDILKPEPIAVFEDTLITDKEDKSQFEEELDPDRKDVPPPVDCFEECVVEQENDNLFSEEPQFVEDVNALIEDTVVNTEPIDQTAEECIVLLENTTENQDSYTVTRPRAAGPGETLQEACAELAWAHDWFLYAYDNIVETQNAVDEAQLTGDDTQIQALQTQLGSQHIELSMAGSTCVELYQHVDAMRGESDNQTTSVSTSSSITAGDDTYYSIETDCDTTPNDTPFEYDPNVMNQLTGLLKSQHDMDTTNITDLDNSTVSEPGVSTENTPGTVEGTTIEAGTGTGTDTPSGGGGGAIGMISG